MLLWTRATHRLAIKAALKGDKNAFAVLDCTGDLLGSLRARSFLSHIGWNAQSEKRGDGREEKMFEVTLPLEHLGQEKGGNPRRKTGVKFVTSSVNNMSTCCGSHRKQKNPKSTLAKSSARKNYGTNFADIIEYETQEDLLPQRDDRRGSGRTRTKCW